MTTPRSAAIERRPVIATVVSGLDYFFGLRKRIAEQKQRTAEKAAERDPVS